MSETSPDTSASVGGQTDERARVSRAAHVLGAMTMVSRLAGLVRDAAISAVFGTGTLADAFFVAFRIPNLFRRVVAEGATSAAFVPLFTENLAQGGAAAAVRAAAAVGGAAALTLAALTTAGIVAAPQLTMLFAPGFSFDPGKEALTIELTRWTFPYLFLVGLAAWAMGVHHTFRRFALPAVGPVLMNLSIIAFTLGVAPWMAQPVWALVGGVLVGGTVQVAVQVPSLWRQGLRPRLFTQLAHPSVRRCGSLVLAAVLGGSVYQVNVLVATIFASLLPAGTVSYLWYADRLFEFPLGIVAVAVGTAALPSLASQKAAGDLDGLGETVVHAMSMTVAFCLPAAVGLAMLSQEITALLFERGSFGATDTAMTAWALRASVPGLLGVGLVRVLSAAFFALGRPRVPVGFGLATMVLNVGLSISFMGAPEQSAPWWGQGALAAISHRLSVIDLRHAGLSLAAGLSATANAVGLFVALRCVLPSMKPGLLLWSAAVHLAAAVAMAAAVSVWMRVVGPSVVGGLAVSVGGAVLIGCVIYAGVALMLGSREVGELLASVRNSSLGNS